MASLYEKPVRLLFWDMVEDLGLQKGQVLTKKPAECLEYVLVHEMVHLLERLHNVEFKAYMDRFMPQWRLHRDLLNQAPLPHEDWTY
jgi:hypothetical protein